MKRRDGARSRAPVAALFGERRERGQVVYGVREGEDLWLPDRPGCPVQRRLSQWATGATPAWTRTEGFWVSLVQIAAAALGFVVLLCVDGAHLHTVPVMPPLMKTASQVGMGLIALSVFLWGRLGGASTRPG